VALDFRPLLGNKGLPAGDKLLLVEESVDLVEGVERDGETAQAVDQFAVVDREPPEHRFRDLGLLAEGLDPTQQLSLDLIHREADKYGQSSVDVNRKNRKVPHCGPIIRRLKTTTGMEIADEIRRRMRLLGLSPERLSLAAGLNKTYVRDIFNGRARSPKLDNLAKLAGALGCSVDQLTGQDPPRREGQAQTDPELLRQAYAVATRITAEDDPATRAADTATIAAAIYDVLIERMRSGRALADEAEILAVIEGMFRRMLRDDRETGVFAAIRRITDWMRSK
jgi:transcriptional regulator with XRE-family HTH domain